MILDRRAALAGLCAAAAAAPAWARPQQLDLLAGKAVQGGTLIGRTAPRALISVDGEPVGKASNDGWFVVGFDRDAAPAVSIRCDGADRTVLRQLTVKPVDYDIQRVEGLPQDTVTPEDPALLARIAQEAARKREGFASNVDADWFTAGFDMPLTPTRVSGRFGGQRVLNGLPSTPHYGADLAAPLGTAIKAPCEGVVAFAETGLHYEGGLTLIDHGQGLVTAYLHQSKIEVQKGDRVVRGQKIGEVGMEGRATGPHLCWRMKWRGRNCDPTLLVGERAPRK